MRTHSLFLFVIFSMFAACSENAPSYVPSPEEEKEDNSLYEWEKNRTELLENKDMVLLYAGGSHRGHEWNEEYVEPYVTNVDESGNEHWMFDSFLFLEIHNGEGKTFASGYTPVPANQYDWKKLLDYYFQSRYCLGALNRSVESAKERLGKPTEKRKVVIGIPEPIKTQKDWGSVSNGALLDFSKPDDRISACQWYIDYARKKFKEMNYENIDLAGFYWIAEEATNSRGILADLSAYLNNLKYGFVWIPYHGSDGAFDWERLTFNYAYYQPNYFFNDSRPVSFLNKACEDAKANGMDMEIEFDDRVMIDRGNWGYRLENYMKAFKEYGIWESKRLAYYQGNRTLYELFKSNEEEDQQLYHKFCKFVTERQIKNNNIRIDPEEYQM
ncbi:protein of unknown function [Mariniphaga anaerophila]|uniref:DUF4855 domain-containing protein n=1 Tax=Mariniphaga anaerophila TaxID=1484053 RepID=A0A1M4T4Q0_9BACT|nr:DUF4855 domain-containing protein [Mariniphaga anaerophila]SHE39384.1 protein of unknown function [Mariniphaga anaerophila]